MLSETDWSQEILVLYFTIIPIILVFQGLELQNWLDRARALLGEYDATPSKFAGMSGQTARKELSQRLKGCKKAYPSPLSMTLLATSFIVILASGYLGYVRYRTATLALCEDIDLLFLWGSLVLLLAILLVGLIIPQRSKKQELQALVDKLNREDLS